MGVIIIILVIGGRDEVHEQRSFLLWQSTSENLSDTTSHELAIAFSYESTAPRW